MKAPLVLVVAALLLTLLDPAVAKDEVAVAPGDAVAIEGGPGGCSLGFLLTGSDGARYMSTAGHCFLGERETRVSWPAGRGPEARTADGAIGRLVFAQNVATADAEDFFDFAVIRLHPAVTATAAVGSSGAPAKINTERRDEPSVLHVFGQAVGVGLVAPGRDLYATTLRRDTHVYAHGPALPGDSGAPVVDGDGAAVGTLLGAGGIPYGVGLGGVNVGHDGALNRIGRLRPVLQHAAAAIKVRLQLATPRASS